MIVKFKQHVRRGRPTHYVIRAPTHRDEYGQWEYHLRSRTGAASRALGKDLVDVGDGEVYAEWKTSCAWRLDAESMWYLMVCEQDGSMVLSRPALARAATIRVASWTYPRWVELYGALRCALEQRHGVPFVTGFYGDRMCQTSTHGLCHRHMTATACAGPESVATVAAAIAREWVAGVTAHLAPPARDAFLAPRTIEELHRVYMSTVLVTGWQPLVLMAPPTSAFDLTPSGFWWRDRRHPDVYVCLYASPRLTFAGRSARECSLLDSHPLSALAGDGGDECGVSSLCALPMETDDAWDGSDDDDDWEAAFEDAWARG